jgi:Flp pilus assembly protein TadD
MAYNNLGKVKLDQGWIGEALLYFQVAVMLKPDYAEANNNLGNALRANGRVEEAIVYFRKSTAFRPSVAAFHGDLANTLAEAGHLREAVSQYELALAINPADVRLSNNLAWILSTSSDSAVRNGSRAVELAGKAVKLSGGNDPVTTSTLAAAYAETGRYAEAVATAEKAHALALRAQMTDQAAWIAGLLEIYRSGRPYHGG